MPNFGIRSGLCLNTAMSGRTETRPFRQTLERALRVEPRSHRKPSCQGRDLRGSRRFVLFPWPSPENRPLTRSRSRPGPEAAISLVKPACSLAFNTLGTINAAHGHTPVRQSPPKTTWKSAAFPTRLLYPASSFASTTVSRGHPGPAPSRSNRRRSRYLPQPRSLNRNSHRPLR